MNRYLVVRDNDGLVVNAVVWDGETEYSPEGCTLVPADDHPGVWIGWRWDGENFQPPPEETPPE